MATDSDSNSKTSSANQPRTIRQLSASVVNKIAAGEVIERPASAVKELMENAVDAGADRIEVRLEKGGMDRIRVSDNGCGIPPEQINLALASHATSKIETADDLFSVHTLGFRGEALASIAEVSHLTLRSRIGESASGFEIEVRGGQASDVSPCACAPGTTLEIRNLFFNTPVRRKYMRTVPTELGHATEAFTRIALAFPQVRFELRHNERVVHELPPVESWRERIATLFGAGVAESLIWVESEDADIKLSGYVANPTQSRSNNKMQYLFLNGRHIRDRSLQHALGEAYRGLLLHGRYPISFLKLELPADAIDVNVHPTKLEVRFQDGGRIYSHLLSTLRNHFLSTDLTATINPLEGPGADDAKGVQESELRDEVTAWARGGQAAIGETGGNGDFSPLPTDASQTRPSVSTSNRGPGGVPEFRPYPSGQGNAFQLNSLNAPPQARLRFDEPLPSLDSLPQSAAPDQNRDATTGVSGRKQNASSTETPQQVLTYQALQIHNRYLVTATDDGMMVIDQHALHERILYEQLREKVLDRGVERQRLLTPEPVDLAPAEAEIVLEHRDTLANLGIEIEAFGGSTVLVQSYPSMVRRADPSELLRQLAEQLVAGDRLPDRRDVVDELLHMISCKSAIKAGDPLTAPEISALLEFRHLVQDSHHCPHGRPTTLVFTRQELDRRFQRI